MIYHTSRDSDCRAFYVVAPPSGPYGQSRSANSSSASVNTFASTSSLPFQEAPYLTHLIRHHGALTLTAPPNLGVRRQPERREVQEKKKNKKGKSKSQVPTEVALAVANVGYGDAASSSNQAVRPTLGEPQASSHDGRSPGASNTALATNGSTPELGPSSSTTLTTPSAQPRTGRRRPPRSRAGGNNATQEASTNATQAVSADVTLLEVHERAAGPTLADARAMSQRVNLWDGAHWPAIF